MTSKLVALNKYWNVDAHKTFFRCCGSQRWAEQMVAGRPFGNEEALFALSEKVWDGLAPADWLEAFKQHPKIGGVTRSLWTKEEQAGVRAASPRVLEELSQLNEEYEKKFGYVFLVCATGKSADEMLILLKERLHNDPKEELLIANREQRKITRLRLEKLLLS